MSYGFIGGYAAHRAATKATQAGAEAEAAANKAERAVQRTEDLQARHALVLKTLLTFCEKKGMFTEPEFLKLMQEIDLADGVQDGKYKPGVEPKRCMACDRVNQRLAVRCIYCGEEIVDRKVM